MQREAIGADRRDIGLAKAVAVLAQVNGCKSQFDDIVKASLPVKLWRDQTLEEQLAALMTFSTVHNAVIEAKHGDEHLNPQREVHG